MPIDADLRATELDPPDRPQRDHAWRWRCRTAKATLRAAAEANGASSTPSRPEVRRRGIPPARSPARLGARSRSAATPSAPCSTPRGRPAGRRVAASRNGYFLRAGEWYLGLRTSPRSSHADRFITPLPLSHMNALRVLVDGGDPPPAAAWSSSTASIRTLVAECPRQPGDDRPLPRRDAGDADRRRRRRRRSPAPRSLRLRCRRGPAPPRRLRGALRLPAARGVGDDRDRRGGLHHGPPRAAPRRHPLLRSRRAGSVQPARRHRPRAPRPRSTFPASCSSAPPARTRARTSSPAT